PVFRTVRGETAVVGEDNEGGQIFVFTSERVGDPGARTRETGKAEARRLQQGALAVHARFADDIVDKGDLINDLAERGDDLAEHLATLPVGRKSPRTGEGGA